MSESAAIARPRTLDRWKLAGWLWLAVVLAIAVHQWSFWRSAQLSTDVLALLPQDERASDVTLATRKLADQASRQIVVMVGAPSWDDARKAVAAFRAAVQGAGWKASASATDVAVADALAWYRPWRDRLLTDAQRRMFQERTVPELSLIHI